MTEGLDAVADELEDDAEPVTWRLLVEASGRVTHRGSEVDAAQITGMGAVTVVQES